MAEPRQTVLITGSTDGVGRRVAVRLGRAGANVLIHGRNAARAEETLAEVRAAGGSGQIHLADFASLAEVRALAQAIVRDQPRLDLLINNAGLGFGEPGAAREESRDGLELRFAVNYLSGFVLTRLLLPLLQASRPARIVNVSSIGQQALDFSDLQLRRRYDGVRAYRQSKLAQIMATFDLAQELSGSGVTVDCLHPATLMDTTMVHTAGLAPVSTIDEGADAILALAAAHTNGLYYDGRRPARANAQAYDAAARAELRQVSLELA